jgi:ribosomal protein S18 acetylase RimI-like enzyme
MNQSEELVLKFVQPDELLHTNIHQDMERIYKQCFPTSPSFQLLDKKWMVLGDKVSQKLYSFASYREQSPTIMSIWDFCTDPSFQSKGYGSTLLNELIKAKPTHRFFLTILIGKLSTTSLYNKKYKLVDIDENATRRITFYSRHHFKLQDIVQQSNHLLIEMKRSDTSINTETLLAYNNRMYDIIIQQYK